MASPAGTFIGPSHFIAPGRNMCISLDRAPVGGAGASDSHAGEITSLRVSADWAYVVSGSKDKTASVFKAATGELISISGR